MEIYGERSFCALDGVFLDRRIALWGVRPRRAWLAITTRTLAFLGGRDDLLDRTIILHVGRLTEFEPENVILQEINDKRNELLTEFLHELNQLVSFIREHGTSVGKVPYRMADFANTAILIGKAKGEEARARRILTQLQEERVEKLASEEPIIDCLKIWLRMRGNDGRQVYSKELNSDLSSVASSDGIRWPYETAHSLGQRLSHIGDALRLQFEVEEGKDTSNQRWYRFRPRKAQSVEGGNTALEGLAV